PALPRGCVLAGRKAVWWPAALPGASAWVTPASGIVLLPSLAAEAGHQLFVTKRWRWQWLWIAVVPAGFAVYLFLNWRISGDPFAFLKMRKELFHVSFSWPWFGFADAVRNILRPPDEGEIVGTQEVFFTIFALICAVVSWFK